MQDYEPLDIQNFEMDGKNYVYDFERLTVMQAEICKAVLLFQHAQGQARPESFKEVLKSGGATWVPYIFAHLIIEKTGDGNYKKWNEGAAETDTFALVLRQQDATLAEEMEKVVMDFFTRKNIGAIYLSARRGSSKPAVTEMLSRFMIAAMRQQKDLPQ